MCALYSRIKYILKKIKQFSIISIKRKHLMIVQTIVSHIQCLLGMCMRQQENKQTTLTQSLPSGRHLGKMMTTKILMHSSKL